MADKITLEPVTPAEPVYIIPAHPEGKNPLSEETVAFEKPITATVALSDLVAQAVAGLRGEILQGLKEDIANAKN